VFFPETSASDEALTSSNVIQSGISRSERESCVSKTDAGLTSTVDLAGNIKGDDVLYQGHRVARRAYTSITYTRRK